jgi:sugar phosphate isomerase/epimerase
MAAMVSRRDFVKWAVAALPAARMFGEINSVVHGVQLGVQTWSYRALPAGGGVDTIINAIVENQLGECELFASHIEPGGMGPLMRLFKSWSERGAAAPQPGRQMPPIDPDIMAELQKQRQWRMTVSNDELQAIRKKFNDKGVNIYAYNSLAGGLGPGPDFDQEADRAFVIAKALGCKIVSSSSPLLVARRMVPFAEKHQMTVAWHGHSNVHDPNQFAKPESFAEALKMSKLYRINLDIGHFTAAGYDPVSFIRQNHSNITHIHLKDRKKNDGPNTPWGEGDTPIKAVLQLIEKNKYPIRAYVEYEYEGQGTPIQEVAKCVQYATAALS